MKLIINAEEMNRAITRIAHEILEKNKGAEGLVLIGIRKGGAVLAKRFQDQIRNIENREVPVGLLDITLYRDDLSEISSQPNVGETEIDFDVTGKKVIVVDDVLFTGRTIRCALDALIDFGRPECIQLAVLIDRGHRELPIKPDYIGKNIPTSKNEKVVVKFKEQDGEDNISLTTKENS
ncbi:MAG: bifunctional pyr operon transcriptional regulator/uracil phosphoribosyltransferase [Omnitrophica bacterium RIFCSPHIGHO2_02_FULL_46_11]|nr:MAG: bifunctional pyr operon transcriptional regulator/uracil phosphoribosyltransferase [Omnitrophica bacterium RIFCSPLOWO2_01_FULL_45_10b]OGW86867.1 MAG: bifunctional pyr operon transcriptional regulator/uracil phosphoribosyltransferase [Omnitrophica bacterium RIFCSPHIGHO2_02_FULL_46_11]